MLLSYHRKYQPLPCLPYFSIAYVPEVVVPSYAAGFIYIPRNLVLGFFITVQSFDLANNRIHYGPMAVFVSLHITLYLYHHYAYVSESIELMKSCHVHSVVGMSKIKSNLSTNSLVMIVRIRVLYLIVIIKSEVWTIGYCCGNGMCCMSFYVLIMTSWRWKHVAHYLPFVERIHQLSVDTPKKLSVSGVWEFHLLSSSKST